MGEERRVKNVIEIWSIEKNKSRKEETGKGSQKRRIVTGRKVMTAKNTRGEQTLWDHTP